MSKPAAKQGDTITASESHIVMVPSSTGSTPTPLPHPFRGTLTLNLSSNVFINGQPAAMQGSGAINTPPHVPTSPGTSFQTPPSNRGIIMSGSSSVKINGRSAARIGDTVQTCADPAPNLGGQLIGSSNVHIGG